MINLLITIWILMPVALVIYMLWDYDREQSPRHKSRFLISPITRVK